MLCLLCDVCEMTQFSTVFLQLSIALFSCVCYAKCGSLLVWISTSLSAHNTLLVTQDHLCVWSSGKPCQLTVNVIQDWEVSSPCKFLALLR